MNKLTYISLFSSAGVGCYGFKQEGFECIATNELMPRRLEIQKANNKCKYDSGYICGDIFDSDVKAKIFNEIGKWEKEQGLRAVTCIVATPPCQGMSVANHKKKNEQGRNSLVIESIKIILDVLPQFFIFENVRAFLDTICTDIDGVDRKIEEAINRNLSKYYSIKKEVLNFKNFGANSSRTRTLVIGVKKDIDIDASELFPTFREEKTLYQVIGNFEPLKQMGEISEKDIYHAFKRYNPMIRKWIENLKEGENAFDNTEENRMPHYYRNSERIITKKGNGDKYRRQFWNKVAPCIHTRNDILASQNTIHPVDDRVFSIREVMCLMSVPNDFKWSSVEIEKIQKMTLKEKQEYLKKHEINIRQSLGEAVPTEIFRQIAHNIKSKLGEIHA